MKKSEIFYVVLVIALMSGAYFFIYRVLFSDKSGNPIVFKFEKEPVDQKELEKRREYYEKQARIRDIAITKKLDRQVTEAYKEYMPTIKMAEDWQKEKYKSVLKLPPEKREKALIEMTVRDMESRQRYEDFARKNSPQYNAYFGNIPRTDIKSLKPK